MADHGGFTVRGDTGTGHVVGELRAVKAVGDPFPFEIWTGTQWVKLYSPEGIEAYNTALRTNLK